MKLLKFLVLIPLIFFSTCKKPEEEEKLDLMVLKAAETNAPDFPTTQGLSFIGKYLEGRTSGRIKLEIYPASKFGGETESIEQVQAGALDLARVNVAPASEFSKTLGVLSLPYLFQDREHLHRVIDGEIGTQLLKDLEKQELIGLGFYEAGVRNLYNRVRPIKTPADLKGLNIRVQKSEVMAEMIKTLGAEPAQMSFDDVYDALQAGSIDGAENDLPSYYSARHYELAKYYSRDQHSMPPDLIVFSKKTWEKLSEPDRRLILEAVQLSIPFQLGQWREFEAKTENELKQAGVIFNEVENIAAFKDALKPMYDKYLADPELKPLVEEIRAVK